MGFESLGQMIFDILVGVSYFIIACMVVRDILNCFSRHDTDGIVKSILSGVVSYGAIFIVTKLLDRVKDLMQ